MEVAIGALVGFGSYSAGMTIFGSTLLMATLTGASLGSMFMKPDFNMNTSSPTYSLGPISNTKSQLLPIPIVYGQCRVGGNVFLQDFLDDKKERMNMFVAVSEGEIQGISDIKANDQDPASLDECSVTSYLGTSSQVKDSRHPTISAELTAQGYTGNYANLAYIALTLKAQEKLTGTPVISSIIQGRKVWTPSGTVYSRNPVWCLVDLMSNTRYGLGMWDSVNGHPDWNKLDYTSILESANYCDELVDGEARFLLDYVVDVQKPCIDTFAEILATFRGFMICRGKVQIRIDKPSSIYKYIDLSHIVEDSFAWRQKDPSEMLNRLTVNWTNPDDSYESTGYIIEDQDRIDEEGIIESTFDLPGITRVEQAARMGAYLLDSANGINNFCSFAVSLEDADIEVGDVIGVTHDLPGWGDYDGEHPSNPAKSMRVIAVEDVEDDSGLECIQLSCAEYVEEVYNDRAGDIPVKIDTGIDNPWNPDEVTDLAVEEQLILGPDGTYHQSAICSWGLPSGILEGIEIWWKYSLDSTWEQVVTLGPNAISYTFFDLEIGKTLQVKIITVSNWGVRSSGAVVACELTGDGEPPATPESVTATGGYRTIILRWNQITSLDFSHVEVWESMDDNRDNAFKIAETSATYFVVSNLNTLDTRWYWLKAVDHANNESGWSTVVSATTSVIPQEDLPEMEISETQTDALLLQSYEQLERDAEGTIQGLVRSYRDRENSITEIAQVSDEVGAMYVLRLESDGSIVGVAMQASEDVADIVFRADKVYFKTSSGEAVPMFTISDGQAHFNGDVFADGSIVGSKIYSKSTISLADGGKLLIGDDGVIQIGDSGPILLDISGDYPRIRVGDPDNPITGDYLEIQQGDIRAYKYYGSAYEVQKNLRKMVSGQGSNNTTVTLSGHWESQPEIMVSPSEIMCFDPAYGGQKQTMQVLASNISWNPTTKICTFKPLAKLVVAAANTTVSPNSLANYSYADGANSIPYNDSTNDSTIPANVSKVHVYAKAYAQRWASASGNEVTYTRLRITVKAVISGSGGGEFTLGTIDMPDSHYTDMSSENSDHYVEVDSIINLTAIASTRTISIKFEVASRGSYYQYTHGSLPSVANSTALWGRFVKFIYEASGATLIKEGTLNYLAIGE